METAAAEHLNEGVAAETKVPGPSAKAGITFPVKRTAKYLLNRRYVKHLSTEAPIYFATVTAELAGKAAMEDEKKRILPKHIFLAVMKDEELREVLIGMISGNTAGNSTITHLIDLVTKL